jgi:hypothetical protein
VATLFSDIYDLFLIEVRDYKLDNLYQSSPTDFDTYLQGFLIKAIPDFDNCNQDLEDFDLVNKQFTATLTLREQTILSELMALKWLTKEVNDVNQFTLHLTDTDFKHYSEAQNLKEKIEHRDRMREIIDQKMLSYGLKNAPWSTWAGGSYDA